MVRKNRGMYGFLGASWVLITYNICPPVNIRRRTDRIDHDLDHLQIDPNLPK